MFALPKSEKGIRGGVARCNRLISGVLAVALATTMTILPTQPAEAATADYQVPVTYGQTEARKMIDMINGFRTAMRGTGIRTMPRRRRARTWGS